jgi:hypothetical protein
MSNYSNTWRNQVGRTIMKLALRFGGTNYRRELILDFMCWDDEDLHPADAHKCINRYDKYKQDKLKQ